MDEGGEGRREEREQPSRDLQKGSESALAPRGARQSSKLTHEMLDLETRLVGSSSSA